MNRAALLLLLVAVTCVACAPTCYTVRQGEFYSSIPFHGLKSSETISSKIQLKNNTATYIFAPTDPNGQLCMTSWNKLYGATRCGYFTSNHKDSDRFAWRRANSCLIFQDGKVIGEKPNCEDAGLIEIAAYAYDNGKKPFEHPSLLKQFATKVRAEEWYLYQLQFKATETVYRLMTADGSTVLEEQIIQHRTCSNTKQGSYQSLYFGGQCPAPSDVTACYD